MVVEELKISKAFKDLIPALSVEELRQLEANILADGCRDPLVVWKEERTLLDGHNRYSICKRNDRPFKVKELSFESETDAKVWMVRNQFGRRNLSPYTRGELALELEVLFAKKAKENQKTSTGGKEPRPLQKSAKAENVDTRKEIAKVAHVSHDTIAKVKLIKAGADAASKQALREGKTTINAVYKGIKKREMVAEFKAKSAAETEEKPGVLSKLKDGNGKFRVIYADPPWQYGDEGAPGGGVAEHYSTMSLAQLKALKVGDLAHEDGCHLWMWTTWPMIRDRVPHDVLEAWGFRWVGEMVWKKSGFGVGRWLRPATEILILAVKGNLKLLSDGKATNAFREFDKARHSAKPEEFYEVIEELSPGPYVELFARRERAKWMRWGNEA